MTDTGILPTAGAIKARVVAEAIMERLSDESIVSDAAGATERLMGYPIWTCDASLYSGAAGSALAFASLAQGRSPAADRWRVQATIWLRRAARSTQETPIASAGVAIGTAGLAFAVNSCAAVEPRFRTALPALHAKLAEQVRRWSSPAGRRHLSFSDYDTIDGLAGILGYLSSLPAPDGLVRDTAGEVIDRLVGRSTGPGDPWSSWLIPRVNYPNREVEHELYPYGYADLGLAHGIPAPLAALSRAWGAGYRRDGMRQAIGMLTALLLDAIQHDTWGVIWPRVMPFDETGAVAPELGRPGGPAYCYGPPGICSVLLDAADALDDRTVRGLALAGFAAQLRRMRDLGGPPTPGLCHGIAGMLVICAKFAGAGSAAAAAAAAVLTDELLAWCDPELPLYVQDYKNTSAGLPGSDLRSRPNGALVDSPGLLEGAAGVALALLTVSGQVPTHWSRALLVG